MQRIQGGVGESHGQLTTNPLIEAAQGEAIAILNHNRVMAYMVPAGTYEAMLDRLDDLDLVEIHKRQRGWRAVDIDDL